MFSPGLESICKPARHDQKSKSLQKGKGGEERTATGEPEQGTIDREKDGKEGKRSGRGETRKRCWAAMEHHLVAREAVAAGKLDTPGHDVVCVGGTFDHLHAGHRLLLTAGALLLRLPCAPARDAPAQYVIGITGDELLVDKPFAHLIQPWDERARAVIRFLSRALGGSSSSSSSPSSSPSSPRRGWSLETDRPTATTTTTTTTPASTITTSTTLTPDDAADPPAIDESRGGDFRAALRGRTVEVSCVRIRDPFGPTITRQDISALVVSRETRAGGQAVNKRRAELGWPPLAVYEVDVLMGPEDDGSGEGAAGETPAATAAESFAAKISSSAIRQEKAMRLAGAS